MAPIRTKIIELLQSHGFTRAKGTRDGSLWFYRRRDEAWSDVFSFYVYTDGCRFSSVVGIEYSPVRNLALAIARRTSPKFFSSWVSRKIVYERQPSLNIFRAPPGDEAERLRFWRDEIDEEFLARADQEFFSKASSESDYLALLERTDDFFDWSFSAGVFRLIYIGILWKLAGRAPNEFLEYCNGIPANCFDHSLLNFDDLKAGGFILMCIDLIWAADPLMPLLSDDRGPPVIP